MDQLTLSPAGSPVPDRHAISAAPTTGRVRWTAALAAPAAGPASVQLRGLPASSERLAQSRVTLAGVGAVGGPAAEGLVRCGVSLTFVDPDEFGPDSWRTQWCVAADHGASKVDRLLERLHAINLHVILRAGRGWIQDVPWRVLFDSDVLLSAGDNLQMVVAQGRLAAALGKPLVQAAVHPESRSAIVRCWDLREADAACPACALGEADWGGPAVRRGCDVKSLHVGGATPTQTAPFVCVTAGQMAVAEVLRVLAESEADRVLPSAPDGAEHLCEASREILYSLDSHRTLTTPLDRRAQCRSPHRRWRVELLGEGPDDLTLADVFARSPFAGHADRERLEVSSELLWSPWTTCPECRRCRPVGRFAHPGDVVGECECGGVLTARPLGMKQVIPWDDLAERWGRPLAEAGLPSGRAIVIDDGEEPWCGFIGSLRDVPEVPVGSRAGDASTAGSRFDLSLPKRAIEVQAERRC